MTTYKIFRELMNNGTVSGTYIGETVGVSRMAVNKHIKKLIGLGYEIEPCGAGYKLSGGLDVLDENSIRYCLEMQDIELSDVVVATVPSTNERARERMLHVPGDMLIVSPEQSRGRGRFARTFISRPGGIYMSLVLHPKNIPLAKSMLVTILSGLSVYEALTEFGAEVQLKWPNDVILGDKKVCGILTEAVSAGEYVESYVIGVGINSINSIDESIRDIATSLGEHGILVPAPLLIAKVTERLIENMRRLSIGQSSELLADYKHVCNTIGRNVTVTDMKESYNADVQGLDEQGFLIIERAGERVVLTSGDISLNALSADAPLLDMLDLESDN